MPLDPEIVEQVIAQERIDGILLSFGGQTALNCGLALAESGVLAKHGVQVLGTPIASIRDTEDRKRFNERLEQIDVPFAKGDVASTVAAAEEAAHRIGLPVILRGAFALGGRGSSIVEREEDLKPALKRIFDAGIRRC